MAVSKTDLLQFIANYQTDNKRPCPKSAILATYGEDALDILGQLVKDASISSRRGRNGGFFPIEGADANNETAESSPAAESNEDISDQFAALNAKLAALEESENQTDSEQTPF